MEPVKTKTLAEVHAEDHAQWLAQAMAILQPKCSHLYHHQRWYTCMLCGYEETWEHTDNCVCTFVETSALTDAFPVYRVTARKTYCVDHGIDYKIYPVSDRKQGPYGTKHKRADAEERSKALTSGRYSDGSMRKIKFDIEGTK